MKGLSRGLEKALGPREQWTVPVLRGLWAALHAGLARRRRSADHERQWLSLTGYALRPGFGAPLDAWRAAQTFAAFREGLQFQAESHNWQAWWVLWRRIAGGLDEASQNHILDVILPFLPPLESTAAEAEGRRRPPGSARRDDPPRRQPRARARRPQACHRRGAARAHRSGRAGAAPPVGARPARRAATFHGSGHACVGPEHRRGWLGAPDRPARPSRRPGLSRVAARAHVGDRARDLSPEAREEALAALRRAGASAALLGTVEEPVALEAADEQRIFGESLPAGLKLL